MLSTKDELKSSFEFQLEIEKLVKCAQTHPLIEYMNRLFTVFYRVHHH